MLSLLHLKGRNWSFNLTYMNTQLGLPSVGYADFDPCSASGFTASFEQTNRTNSCSADLALQRIEIQNGSV